MDQAHAGKAHAPVTLISRHARHKSSERALQASSVETRQGRHEDNAFWDRPVPSHNLRLQPTRLVGRESELRAARQQLLDDETRLLTLTGPAGVGKTRLALALAHEVRPVFPDGVWLVELAAVEDPEQVPAAIAQVLGLPETESRVAGAVLQAYLASRQLLLVLDNFEQVLSAATQIADLLATCPGLKILATSRTRLRLRWERVRPVRPLAWTATPPPATIEAVAELPAVTLFVERAQASHPGFALTPENVAEVQALCQHLEGLPLAIELAAAHANILTLDEMIGWTGHRLTVLGWEAHDLPARHQTLRAALEWSYELLPAAEQALLRRLSVFSGGWTLDAARAVSGVDALRLDPRDGLAALVDASLLQVSQNDNGETRFGMFETLREFVGEFLASSDEQDETLRRHAEYFATLADAAKLGLEGGGQQHRWFEHLDLEHENLRAALGWATRTGDSKLQLRLASSLAHFWWSRGYLSEGREWLASALARGPDAPAEARLEGSVQRVGHTRPGHACQRQ